ncbi:MAG: hypothetical protein K2X09_02905 [Rickettsiales bacterium]|nr:hypothetical protein [Rickettsiales bacterium]
MSTTTMGRDAFKLSGKIAQESLHAVTKGFSKDGVMKPMNFLAEVIGEQPAKIIESLGAHLDGNGTAWSWFKKEAMPLAGGYAMAKTGEAAIKAVEWSKAADKKAFKDLGDLACKFFTRRDMAGLGRFIIGR